jgi:dihydrofolate reductase
MSTIVVTNHVTLDGVMQSPASPDEDTRGGFTHGGWAAPYQDEVIFAKMAEGMARPGALLLGRRTYEHFAAFWPTQTDNPYTEVLNNTQKYVASRTLSEPLPWQNSTLLQGDAADAVAELKASRDGYLNILGSGDLIASLLPRGLIDEWLLTIHPLVLGSGRRLFPDGSPHTSLELTEVKPATTGVLIATYRRKGDD